MTKLNSKSSTDRLRLYSGVHWIEREYDPNETYYFVDYDDLEECRWVREGYCDTARLRVLLANLPYARDWEQGGKYIPLFKNLRVTPEEELEELRKGAWNEETKSYEKDFYTNRVLRFDKRYEVMPEFSGGREPLSKKENETQEEWEKRVETHNFHKELRTKEEITRDCDLADRVRSQKENNNGTLKFVWGGFQVGDY
jgi:hypothetical protein